MCNIQKRKSKNGTNTGYLEGLAEDDSIRGGRGGEGWKIQEE